MNKYKRIKVCFTISSVHWQLILEETATTVSRNFDPHSGVCTEGSTCYVRYTRLNNRLRESTSARPHIQDPLAGLEDSSAHNFLHSPLHIVWDWMPKAVVIVIEEIRL